jgi:hypothetical protein
MSATITVRLNGPYRIDLTQGEIALVDHEAAQKMADQAGITLPSAAARG